MSITLLTTSTTKFAASATIPSITNASNGWRTVVTNSDKIFTTISVIAFPWKVKLTCLKKKEENKVNIRIN